MNTSVRQAFDRHASVYDQVFTSSQIRSEVWEIADPLFFPGAHVLDLGCGTGEDSIHFASRGVAVTAIDLSPGMISRLEAKAHGLVRTKVAGMETFAAAEREFDGIFSNFGALNCSPDLAWLGKLVHRALKPGSHVVVTTMGRFYPLESAVFLLKYQFRQAMRRLHRPATAMVEGVRFDVYYYSVRAIRAALGPDFELKQLVGLRSLLPVPGLEHLERFGVFKYLRPIDRLLCSNPLTATWSDHFVSVWQFRETQGSAL
ncbi:MAG: methyltransferase domain-containing protein [Acidobacteria bacterium]|nr:methyltransferase domain-containing protein [Acidobacteriota bacterium]